MSLCGSHNNDDDQASKAHGLAALPVCVLFLFCDDIACLQLLRSLLGTLSSNLLPDYHQMGALLVKFKLAPNPTLRVYKSRHLQTLQEGKAATSHQRLSWTQGANLF